MLAIQNNIHIEFNELINTGIPERTIKSWVDIKSTDPNDNRKKIFPYELLKPKYQQQVVATFGDPYIYIKRQAITQHLKAININPQFNTLNRYRYSEEGLALPTDRLHDYTEACRYLELLKVSDKKFVKELGFKDTVTFYQFVIEQIKENKIDLPTSYSKLMKKLKQYKENGALTVISQKFGNQNSRKVKEEKNSALLLELISDSKRFDDEYISQRYNKWATANGHKTITGATVGNYRRDNALLVTATREGSGVWRNTFDKSVRQDRPSAPLLLINSDDNVLDWFFTEVTISEKGNKKTNPYYKYTLMVVIDAFNDYPLGYAIGEGQTVELVKASFLNAVHHIKELTGESIIWHQLKADHWGLKQLEPWYNQHCIFTPPKLGNARSKVIEQSFGKAWHKKLKEFAHAGYSGYNITAKTHINREAITLNSKKQATKEEGILLINEFINAIRNDKREAWLNAFNKSTNQHNQHNQPIQLNDHNRLLWFGQDHTYTNELTKDGLQPTINGKKMLYEIPDAEYRKHVGKKVTVKYDPYDLSSVLAIADGGKIQIHCPLYERTKMALADMTEGDRRLLNVKLSEKKALGQFVLDAAAKRRDILGLSNITPSALLEAGVMTKELRHEAEQLFQHNQHNQPNQPNKHNQPNQHNQPTTRDEYDDLLDEGDFLPELVTINNNNNDLDDDY